MSLEILQRIDANVERLWQFFGGETGAFTLPQRLEKIENALFSGSGQGIIITSASIAQTLQSTNYVLDTSGWKIWRSGDVEFQDGKFRGTIYAEAGEFTDVVYVGSAADRIIIDGSNKNIRSEGFTTGVEGWKIDSDGTAEFEHVIVRGELRASVFTKDEVSARAGTSLLVKSAGVLMNDVTTVAFPTQFNVDIVDPQSGHAQIFDNGDRLRLTVAGTTNWVTIVGVTDMTTYYRYACVLNVGGGSPATWYAGTAVADYGQLGNGNGGILETADATNAPYISIFTHAGSPWSTVTELVRIGNLNGSYGQSSDVYGAGFGDYSTDNYVLIDGSTPSFLIKAGSGAVSISGTEGIGIIGDVVENSTSSIEWFSPDDDDRIGFFTVVEAGTGITNLTIDNLAPNTPSGVSQLDIITGNAGGSVPRGILSLQTSANKVQHYIQSNSGADEQENVLTLFSQPNDGNSKIHSRLEIRGGSAAAADSYNSSFNSLVHWNLYDQSKDVVLGWVSSGSPYEWRCQIESTTVFSVFSDDERFTMPKGPIVSPGSDTDVNLVESDVTGSPKIWWDQSANAITSSHDVQVAQGKSVLLQGSSSTQHSSTQRDVLEKIGHILDGGHPVNPYPSTRDSDDAEFNNSTQAVNNSVGTHAGGDFWELKSGGAYGSPSAYDINSTADSCLYVSKAAANSATEVAFLGDITTIGEDEIAQFEAVLVGVRGQKIDSFCALRLYDSSSGWYARVRLNDDPTNGLTAIFEYDNGGGLTTAATLVVGFYVLPIAFGIVRYISGANAYWRGFFSLGGGLPQSKHFAVGDNITQTTMGAKASFVPDEIWLEFSNSSGGTFSTWTIDSFRRTS